MTAAFRENWKRLSDKGTNRYQTGDDPDLVRFKDQHLLTTNASGIDGKNISGTPSANQILRYNGIEFIYTADSGIVINGTPTEGQGLIFRNGMWVPALTDASGINGIAIVGAPASGESLTYNGTNWSPASGTGGGGGGGAVDSLVLDIANEDAVLYRLGTKTFYVGNASNSGLGSIIPAPFGAWYPPSTPSASIMISNGLILSPNSVDASAIRTRGANGLFWAQTSAASAAATNNGSNQWMSSDSNPLFVYKFQIETISNIRLLIGLADGAAWSSDNFSNRTMHLRFSTGFPDTFFTFVIDDASTRIEHVTSIPGDTEIHYFVIDTDSGNSVRCILLNEDFIIEEEHVFTTNLPTASNYLVAGGAQALSSTPIGFNTWFMYAQERP